MLHLGNVIKVEWHFVEWHFKVVEEVSNDHSSGNGRFSW